MNRIIKIQNFMLPKTKDLEENRWLFYRGDRLRHNIYDSSWRLKKKEQAEFLTYFNAFSLEKWKLYTNVRKVSLSLTVKGRIGIQLFGHYVDGDDIRKEIISENYFEAADKKEIILPVPMDIKSQVVGYQIFAYSELSIYGGGYIAEINADSLNPVDISLVTVTFKKEDFITRNLRIIENEILYSEEELADHLFVRVIDNGRTLSAEEWDSDRIRVYSNPNVGGSGGYTRGIIESLSDNAFWATHVLLMDDDVKVLPESLIRTYNLLRCVKTEYRDHFISGAMLYYERMHVQHEDVGYIDENGQYGPRKPIMEMHLAQSVIRNEKIYEDKPNNYAGWWYCCIPRWKTDINRLPLPLFIRGDDVEFSIRNHARFITLNGICIWHMGFVKKFNMPMEFYQVHRNSLIIQAVSDVTPEIDYVNRISRIFFTELKRFNYEGCDLLLDAIEDFLKGPEFIMKPSGEELMKEKSAKSRKLVDIQQNYPAIGVDYSRIYQRDKELKRFKRFWYDKTYNGHLLPTFMLDKRPGVIAYDWYDAPEKQYLRESVLAVNPHERTGIRRYRSRREFLRLMKRYKLIVGRYKKDKNAIKESYVKAKQQITSLKFWQGYLN